MSRIWDCCPYLLNSKHLNAERFEAGQLLTSVLKRRAGDSKVGRFSHHPEATWFLGRPDLLVARLDFLQLEKRRRHGRSFADAWISMEHDDGTTSTLGSQRIHLILPEHHLGMRVIEVDGDLVDMPGHEDEPHGWLDFCTMVGWPTSYGDRYWSPWLRDQVTLKQYAWAGDFWTRQMMERYDTSWDETGLPKLEVAT